VEVTSATERREGDNRPEYVVRVGV
jgi:hypothetical protein